MNGALYTQHRKTPKNPESLTSRVEALLKSGGPATSGALAGLLGTGKSHVTNALATLQKACRAHTSDFNDAGEAIYTAGRRPPKDDKPAPDPTSVAGPRQIIGVGTYTPSRWSAPRPGTTQQELAIPSQGPTGRTPWRRPTHGCVGALADKSSNARG